MHAQYVQSTPPIDPKEMTPMVFPKDLKDKWSEEVSAIHPPHPSIAFHHGNVVCFGCGYKQ